MALIRHPIAQLQACYYDSDWDDYADGKPFDLFIIYKYRELVKTFDYEKHLPYRNIQLYMFGHQPMFNDIRNAVKLKISQIDEDFDLVMIQEHMLESLVLLRHQLNWDMKSVVLFGLHSRPEDYSITELGKDVNDTIILFNEGRKFN